MIGLYKVSQPQTINLSYYDVIELNGEILANEEYVKDFKLIGNLLKQDYFLEMNARTINEKARWKEIELRDNISHKKMYDTYDSVIFSTGMYAFDKWVGTREQVYDRYKYLTDWLHENQYLPLNKINIERQDIIDKISTIVNNNNWEINCVFYMTRENTYEIIQKGHVDSQGLDFTFGR